jgi:hypothetical protein
MESEVEAGCNLEESFKKGYDSKRAVMLLMMINTIYKESVSVCFAPEGQITQPPTQCSW